VLASLGVSVSTLRSWRGRGSHLYPLKTCTAQYASTLRRLKRNCGGCSTPRANGLSFLVVVFGGGVSFSLATLTVLGVVCELLVKEKELLTRRKNEIGVAVNALQSPVSKFHGFFLSGTNFCLKQSPVIVPQSAPSRGRTRRHPPAFCGRGSERAAGHAVEHRSLAPESLRDFLHRLCHWLLWSCGDDEHAEIAPHKGDNIGAPKLWCALPWATKVRGHPSVFHQP
jgi:hypothetical protein